MADRFARRSIILLYHRVAVVPSDPQLLCVTPKHFAEHLDVLQKCMNPMPLRQLVPAVRNRKIPHRRVIVTFDDGYADNMYIAKPLLERYEIPATVFVASGYLGQTREFWWDELERLLLQAGTLPETLRLNLNGRVHEWSLGEASHYRRGESNLRKSCRGNHDRLQAQLAPVVSKRGWEQRGALAQVLRL